MRRINEINELRQIQLDILNHVNKFCKENNIRYFLAGGTLLGAIRHKGYIPWDDDIDIMMPRKDYEQFKNIYLKKTNTNYKLYHYSVERKYNYPFIKIGDKRTSIIENQIKDNDFGVNIDIFPLDKFTNDKSIQKKYFSKNRKLRLLLWRKQNKINWNVKYRSKTKTFLKNIILYIYYQGILNIISKNYICKTIDRNSKNLNNSSNLEYMGGYIWGYYEKELIPIKAFKDSVPVEFEGNFYPAPIGYDRYLTGLFGNYMQLPPESERVHHIFTAYWK